jgi:hypothetical protein
MGQPVSNHLPLLSWIFLLAGLTGSVTAHSAGASASATASVIAPSNASSTFSAYELLFDTSTGSLSIRMNGSPARLTLLEPACIKQSGGYQCNSATTLQMASDNTLNEGVSVSLIQSDADKTIVMAMLAYN